MLTNSDKKAFWTNVNLVYRQIVSGTKNNIFQSECLRHDKTCLGPFPTHQLDFQYLCAKLPYLIQFTLIFKEEFSKPLNGIVLTSVIFRHCPNYCGFFILRGRLRRKYGLLWLLFIDRYLVFACLLTQNNIFNPNVWDMKRPVLDRCPHTILLINICG